MRRAMRFAFPSLLRSFFFSIAHDLRSEVGAILGDWLLGLLHHGNNICKWTYTMISTELRRFVHLDADILHCVVLLGATALEAETFF